MYARSPRPPPSQTIRTSAFAIVSCPYDPSTTVVVMDPQHKNLDLIVSSWMMNSTRGDLRSIKDSKEEEEVGFDHRSDSFGGVEIHSDRRDTTSGDVSVNSDGYKSDNSHMGIRDETVSEWSRDELCQQGYEAEQLREVVRYHTLEYVPRDG